MFYDEPEHHFKIKSLPRKLGEGNTIYLERLN
jgi:hypothetical protein